MDAINCIFKWYKNSAKCYVYLSDVTSEGDDQGHTSSPPLWNRAFCNSRWFTRGWTLQEHISAGSARASYLDFSVDERLDWCPGRKTRRPEDIACCMLVLLNVHMSLIYGEGMDNEFRRLQEEINWRQRISNGPLKPSRHPISAPWRALWTVPFGCNKHFVHRVPILSRLFNLVSPDADADDCQQTILERLRGIGKTHIALELAYRLREHQPEFSLFWVPAMDTASFENGYRQIAKCQLLTEASREEEDDTKHILSLVKDALSQEKWGSCLLIIGNTDNTDLVLGGSGLAHYPPFSRRGSILLATRNHEITTGLDVPLELIFPTKNATGVRDLFVFLANLPLATRQASSYMATTGMTTTKYLAHCRSSPRSFIKLLRKDFEDRFMCLLSEKEIPMYLLPIAEDELSAEEAIDSVLFSIHRLVRLATQNWIKTEGDWGACIDEFFSESLELRGGTRNRTALLSLISGVAEGNHIIGKFAMAEQMHRKTLAMRLETLGESLSPIHSVMLHTLNDFTILLQRQGEYKEAENLHRATFSLLTATHGANHPSTLDSKRNIAYTLRKQGRYSEAEPLQREVLASTETIFGTHHPETMQNLNNLASTLLSQGHAEEAESMYRSAMLGLVNELGDAHPKTLKSKSNLARALTSLGKYSQAEKLHREALEAMTRVLGRQHPDTLQGMSKLGVSLWRQGKYTEAEQLHREALEIYSSTLSPGHPDTIRGLNNLLVTLDSQKKSAEVTRLRSEWEERRRVADREGL
ncbi:kinesin light chain 1 [Nemania diffusa]|nr:kinesin light chain 1 [Nemania diffusa]